MRVEEAISGRRSVREYTGEPVDEPTLRRLVDAAVKAPNAVNDQPWAFTVVRDQALLDRISREAKAHMLETMPPGGPAEHFRARLSDPDFHIFYHAPALVVISAVAPGPWIVEDCALAAENLMLAAYSEHVGTCWIGFAQGFLNTSAGKSLIGAPADSVPIAPIILGKPKSPPPPVPRREPEIRWIG
jgi:nitroreductase